MEKRTELINKLIKDNGYKSYLEIGLNSGLNFKDVICEKKVSVDPEPFFNADFIMTSDEFFNQNNEFFDIVFIDGMHLAEFVYRDVKNSINFLNKGGIIIIHDCLPTEEIKQERVRQTKDWEGDVWKAIVKLAGEMYHLELIEIESGIVLLRDKLQSHLIPDGELNWEWFQKNFKLIF